MKQWIKSLGDVFQTGIVVLDRNNEPDFATEQAYALLGVANLEELKQHWSEWTRRMPAFVRGEARHVAGAIEKAGAEFEFTPPGQDRELQLQFFEIEEEDCVGWTVLVREARSQEAMRLALTAGEQYRNDCFFLSAVVHDLRSPLQAIAVTAALLDSLEDTDSGEFVERRRQAIHAIRNEVNQMGCLVEGILVRDATMHADSKETFLLEGLLMDMKHRVATLARTRNIEFTIECGSEPVAVRATRAEVIRGVLNLVVNAFEAISTDGAIRLGITLPEPGTAAIVVVDNGSGMSPELVGRSRDAYFTTKSDGTGLGLHLASSIAEAYGGRLDVESMPGVGTTVRIVLPRAEMPHPIDSASTPP